MARSKSGGFTNWLFRGLMKLIEIVLIVLAFVYLINLVGAIVIKAIQPGCHANNYIYNQLSISDFFVMLFLFGGIFLCRRVAH